MAVPSDRLAWLDEARALIGAEHVLTQDLDAFNRDWNDRFVGSALAVLRPADTAQVQALVRLCARDGVAIVPQGGNTGICGACIPDASGTQVVLSLARLNKVREIDVPNGTLTVEAGCILQTLQELAAEHGRVFPLFLGAQGSCQIGGNISTNAGGAQVLRYGNTRELVLGLEVVLPDGRLLDLLRGLRKDNSGYDLKQCFIGAEGTLGIVTAATVKLAPAPASKVVAFAGIDSLRQGVDLLQALHAALGDRFNAFELVSDTVFQLVRKHVPATTAPLDRRWPWYVLMELADGNTHEVLSAGVQAALEQAFDAGLLGDVALASTEAQAAALWRMREDIAVAQKADGLNIKHDIAVAVSQIPGFVGETLPLLEQAYPGSRPLVFGHLGDGNLHFNLAMPPGASTEWWKSQSDAVNKLVHDVVVRRRGSISAEHGIGQLKRHELGLYKTPAELAVMWAIKRALDPQGIMNPGKVLPAPDGCDVE